MIRSILFIFLSMLIMSLQGSDTPQNRFVVKEVYDQVTISYKWKRTGFFRKDAPLKLVLKIRNSNPHKVIVNFQVDFYWKVILHSSSEEMEYCIKPRRTIRGELWDMVFSTGEFSREQINNEMFSWEISGLDILNEADCNNRLRIIIKPEV